MRHAQHQCDARRDIAKSNGGEIRHDRSSPSLGSNVRAGRKNSTLLPYQRPRTEMPLARVEPDKGSSRGGDTQGQFQLAWRGSEELGSGKGKRKERGKGPK